ncbi:MAG: hypothetical protein IT379_03750, partial [Deltaproteobacteria bacterium]|nr:hypothetical protein [Deltaproteobacteria bacterium]
TRGVSAFDQRVREHMARTSSPISRLLSAPGLARRRFAWTAPWATVLGMPRERYGDRLVRILLRPEAIVGRFLDGTRDAWSFSDLGGRNVPARTVLRDPSRLAAVYHEGPRTSSASGTFVRTETFREIVVVNESMIEQWEVATPAIVERLARDATLVRALVSSLGPARDSARELTARWARRPPRPTIEQLYAAAIALPTVLYVERREAGLEDAATALDRALALARAEAPISIAPPRDFVLGSVPSVRPPAPPPSRPSRPRGTYIGSFAAPGGGTAAPR